MKLVMPWKMAALAAAKGKDARQPVLYLDGEKGDRMGLMQEDLQEERWRIPPHVMLRMGMADSYHGAMAAAPAAVQASMFRSLLAEMSHWESEGAPITTVAHDFSFVLNIVNRQGDFLMASRESWPGLALEELIGGNVCDWLPSDAHDRVLWVYDQAVANGRWFESHDVMETEGGLFLVRAWAGPSSNGRVIVVHTQPTKIDSLEQSPPRRAMPL